MAITRKTTRFGTYWPPHSNI